MEATFLAKQHEYIDLIEMDDQQLLQATFDLITAAPMTELTNCFENVFKENVMKFVLKQVLTECINNLSMESSQDWQRILFINKIMKFKHTSQNLHSPYDDDKQIERLAKINTKQSNKPMYKSAPSTLELLLHGYIRHEIMNTAQNKNRFLIDILTIFHSFIGNCSNIINPDQLIIFNHTSNDYQQVLNHQNKLKTSVSTTADHQLMMQSAKQLISPYKLLIDNKWIFDEIPQYPNATDISCNIQQIPDVKYGEVNVAQVSKMNSFKSMGDPTPYKFIPPPPPPPGPSGSSFIPPSFRRVRTRVSTQSRAEINLLGVSQYLDRDRGILYNFGGIRKKFEKSNYPTYTDTRSIFAYDLKSHQSHDSKTQCVINEMHGKLEYARGNASVCSISSSLVALIGGKRNRGSSRSKESIAVDFAEIYNLEKSKVKQ